MLKKITEKADMYNKKNMATPVISSQINNNNYEANRICLFDY